MYKLLLSWRYLRTRYIALASIISVTLGVATLIVVNSVMAGFSTEMHKRLQGILSDIEFTSPGMDGLYDPAWHMKKIRRIVGDDLAGITAIVRVPGVLHFQFNGQVYSQEIMLIGIDDASYADISDFSRYLLHPENQRDISFELRESGYSDRLPDCGWMYRRRWLIAERAAYLEQQRERELRPETQPPASNPPANDGQESGAPFFAPLPSQAPRLDGHEEKSNLLSTDGLGELLPSESSDTNRLVNQSDPFGASKRRLQFDEMNEHYTGLILGIAVASSRRRNPDTNEVEDVFAVRPGDDVQVTMPSAGVPPNGVSAKFTVVDLYECKMHEYDSRFAFVPLSKLQHLRGMFDPKTGIATVSSIQIKLKDDSKLAAVQARLQKYFPPQHGYYVRTWRDIQGPLLSAVQLETTILNILLFLIIAVAGFGILATFFMIVVEKTRDIGILKALGAPKRGVMSIFLTYGISLGIVGSTVGIGLGLLIVANINEIADFIERISGHEIFDPTVYYFDRIPTIINPWTVGLVAVGAVLIAVAASVLPSLRAARLHPVEALRYE